LFCQSKTDNLALQHRLKLPIVEALSILLKNDADTQALGRQLAIAQSAPQQKASALCVHLSGELGAGKSTLSRAWLRALGVTGAIKSPTYALIEPYGLPDGVLLHLDLYRLSSANEMEYLGIDAYLAEARLVLIEWPERGGDQILPADLKIALSHTLDDQRLCRLQPISARAELMLKDIGSGALFAR
jgi:tRNA threonylcarbamoyladenosine biosynthesis protein TsaE